MIPAIEHAYQQSREQPSTETEMHDDMNFDDLLINKQRLARNELLVRRHPDVQADYEMFQDQLRERGVTLQEQALRNIGSGCVRAALIPDEYPANISSGVNGLNVVHYNLWLAHRDDQTSPLDFAAGEEVLDNLDNRKPDREAYCFKRPPTQSLPRQDGFLFEHCHVFTEATLSMGSIRATYAE